MRLTIHDKLCLIIAVTRIIHKATGRISNESYCMKKLILLGTLAGALVAATPAQAGGFFSVNIGLPGILVNFGTTPPPVCFAPAPVCVPPPVYYAPPIVVMAPPPVFVRPMPVYGPPCYVVAHPPVVVYRPHHPYRPYMAAPYCR
jgi:hypothetical protein